MEWYPVVFLLLMKYKVASSDTLQNVLLPSLEIDNQESFDALENQQSPNFVNDYEDAKLEYIEKILANMLVVPWPRGATPLVYVENTVPENYNNVPLENTNIPSKKSRYYRKYPWKRQNSRYEPENRYLCQPSKDDVLRLLVALHEARQGTKGQVINFCNRRRSASAIFTNIRFLG